MSRIVCHFSCGAASAVATKLAIAQNAGIRELVVLNEFVLEEHPDNARFRADCEKWFGAPVKVLVNHEFGGSIYEVFEKERFLVSQHGAPCTRTLKRKLAAEFWRPGDIDVLGYTAEEQDRHDGWIDANNERHGWPVLIELSLTKEDCLAMVQRAGIRLPKMYALGYDHNNCVGCVKGGMGYWNKIRVDFPERFERMSRMERTIGHSILKSDDEGPIYLDKLHPARGRGVKEPSIQCGVFCELAEREYQ